jgi:hypothetical protein
VANPNGQENGNGGKAVIYAIAIGAAAFVEQALSELLAYAVKKARAYHQRRKALKSAPDQTIKDKKP